MVATVLGTLVAGVLAGCALWSSGLDCGSPPDFAAAREAFSEGRSRGERFEDERRRFAAHALDCASLDGLRRRDVRRMVGSPSTQDGRDWVYYLGPDFLRMDDQYMTVSFDREGRVDQIGVG